jgi:hypothetical protein
MLAVVGAVAPVAAAARVPRVVLVVGPVGGLTNLYRSLANEAAAEASAAGAEVTKVYSPNATWSAVRHAIDGASIVVYLGHGNGWPSPYRDSLYPPTQNGFGLNPYSGGDDSSHQYFGESSVDNVKLAPNAVVLLSHLCYASGNSEPGLAEGTQSMAIQRADNYAAGFIRAGAEAVVAEAHMGPAYYVRQLLRSQNSIEQIWHDSPSNNGNTMTLTSQRSRDFSERLDPDRPSGGYYRSLVSQGVSSNRCGRGRPARSRAPPRASSPAGHAVAGLAGPDVRVDRRPTAPIAATRSQRSSRWRPRAPRRSQGTQVGIRWDPIMLDARPASSSGGSSPPTVTIAIASPSASPSPSPSGTAAPRRRRRRSTRPTSTSSFPSSSARWSRSRRRPAPERASTSASRIRPRPACTGSS